MIRSNSSYIHTHAHADDLVQNHIAFPCRYGHTSHLDGVVVSIVAYSGCSIREGTLLHPKSQYTTVKYSQKLFEHTYTSDPHGLGTLTRIEFFQQDLLWQSSNTHSHSCSQKAYKHTRSIHRRAIGPLAHHNGTSAHSPSLTCHLPAPTIECLHRPRYKLTCSYRQSVALRITSNLYSFSDHTVLSEEVRKP
jgi:hypothetical protein